MRCKISYLDYLYYKIGKQSCDFSLQIQNKDGLFSKRKRYQEIGFEKNMWWLEKVNARTLLVNEVVLDIDMEKEESEQMFKKRIHNTVIKVLQDFGNCSKYALFNSNQGVHLHLYIKDMFFMSEAQRKDLRKNLCEKYNADPLKCSEKVTIALEFAKHWKSGKNKELIISNIEVFGNGRPRNN